VQVSLQNWKNSLFEEFQYRIEHKEYAKKRRGNLCDTLRFTLRSLRYQNNPTIKLIGTSNAPLILMIVVTNPLTERRNKRQIVVMQFGSN